MGKVAFIGNAGAHPDAILEMAKGQLSHAVVIGVTPNGELYFSSSTQDLPTIHWLASLVVRECLEEA